MSGESVIGKGRLNSTNGEWVDAHAKFAGGDGKVNNRTEEELTETSWNDVRWDDIKEASAKALLDAETDLIDPEVKEKFEQGAMLMWDNFYKSHEDKFFKDRTYLHLEYEDLNPFKIDREGTAAFLQSRTQNKNNNDNNNTTTTTTSENGESANKEKRKREEEEEEKFKNLVASMPVVPRDQKKIVLEAGCGVGNTIFPLVKLNPDKYFYAFDFSPSAIEIFKRNPEYTEENVTAFVCDPTSQEVPTNLVPDNSVDIAIMVFFMSAVDPNKMNNVLTHVYKTLKPGGIVLLRDYGMYDMTQMRFINKRGRKLAENFYMRADGTRTYFFSKESLESMFNQAGFDTSVVKYNTRELRNRKRKLSMYRVWISGRFVKPITNNNSTA